MASRADVACGTRTDATWHARPCGRAVRAHARCRWRTSGADTWQGTHESTRTLEGVPRGERGLAFEGPMGLWALVRVLGW